MTLSKLRYSKDKRINLLQYSVKKKENIKRWETVEKTTQKKKIGLVSCCETGFDEKIT